MEFRVWSFASILILCAVVDSSRHAHHLQRHEYLNHIKRVEKFQTLSSCSVPKETLVQLNEISFTKPILAHEKVSPTISVLNRCESCSSCYMQPGYTCTAKSSEMVNLTFYVTSIDGSRKEYRNGTAQNHISCWCQPTSSIPKK